MVFCGPSPVHGIASWFRCRGPILLLLACLLLPACTTTVKSHTRPVLEMPPQDQLLASGTESRLEKLSVPELLDAGFNHLESENLRLARLHFAMALKKDPQASRAHIGLGDIHLHQRNPGKAKESFRKALDISPESIGALLGLGRSERLQGNFEHALDLFNQALAIDPDDLRTLTELAITYEFVGQESLAESLYAKVVELSPDLASAHNNLGFNYLLQGRYGNAVDQFSRALRLESKNPRYRNNLATAYALSGQEEQALNAFESTVGRAAAFNNLGYIYMTQGEWDKAERSFKKALELNPVFYARAQQNLERLHRMRQETNLHP